MDAEIWDKKMLSHHMNSILVESWDAFNVSSGKVIRDRSVKNKLPPLRPTDLIKTTHVFDDFFQVSSGSKS